MASYFNFNFGFPFRMNNWFMPNFTFQNLLSPFQMPMFNIYGTWFNNLNNYNMYNYNIASQNLFCLNNSIFPYNQNITKTNTDYFRKTTGNTNVVTKSSNIDYSKDNLKLDDYNAFKGERLANIALNNSVGWTGYCASYVKQAIEEAGLGQYEFGHAYQMKSILRNNKNFKEISTEGTDVSKLPAGCVLVYGKGAAGYSSEYGHTEITTGDGRAVSDGITKNLYKKPSAIFIPV